MSSAINPWLKTHKTHLFKKEKTMKKQILTIAALSTLAFSFAGYTAPAHASHPGGTVYADVNGLVCDFCARALEKVFGQQEEVSDINVDLDTKIITIHFKEGQNLEDEKIKALIADSGYDVRGLRHGE